MTDINTAKSDLKGLVTTLYTSEDAEFSDHTAPWSIWADRNPQLVVVTSNLEELQAVIKYLYPTTLDFCVRNTGTGGSSAKDVIISMASFKSFFFDAETEEAVLGAGLSWGEADVLMENADSRYGLVGARCTWVGVTGGTLVGGLSWLSHEYGMFSDPQNFLDAQVILHDGRIVWAAQEEPDLMWALRGGGGNFGVVTALKFKARPVPDKIFGGVIIVPYSSLEETSKAVAAMHRRPTDPKVAMHIISQGPGAGGLDQGGKPDIILQPIDFRGEEHARSEEGFGWVWKLPGAKEVTAFAKSLREINALNDMFKSYNGTNEFWCSAPLLSTIEDDTLVRAWKWFEKTHAAHPPFSLGSTVLLEFMQTPAFNSVSSPSDTAWPHGRGRRHVMQTLLGCPAAESEGAREIAMKRFEALEPEIAGEGMATGDWHAGFLHGFNDLAEVYGENWGKLREVKTRFDSENRFDKGVDLVGEKTTERMVVGSGLGVEGARN